MRILMLTSSYPKYPGETTAPFIEEIAAGIVQRGHEVHVLAPYHPDLRRAPIERGVHLHFFRYAPHPALNIWGYAGSQRGDVRLKGAALVVAPLALLATMQGLIGMRDAGCGMRDAGEDSEPVGSRQSAGERKKAEGRRQKAEGRAYETRDARRETRETPLRIIASSPRRLAAPPSFDLVHAHWVLPNGPPAALVAGVWGVPLVVSLHGSDVTLAERHWATAGAAGFAFRQAAAVTACSTDLRDRSLRLGARPATSSVIPYGVDLQAFAPQSEVRQQVRAELG